MRPDLGRVRNRVVHIMLLVDVVEQMGVRSWNSQRTLYDCKTRLVMLVYFDQGK